MKKFYMLLFTLLPFISVYSQPASAETDTLINVVNKAFNEHNVKEYVSYFSDDAVFYNTPDYKDSVKNKQAFEQLVIGWFTLVPDMKTKVNHTYISGNTVIEEFDLSGTVKALLPGYPANLKDKSFNVKACSVATIENGKIKTLNMYWDYLSMLNQLGWTNIVPGH